jgi:hypothetical protein
MDLALTPVAEENLDAYEMLTPAGKRDLVSIGK